MKEVINMFYARPIILTIICLVFLFNFVYAAEDTFKYGSFVGVVSGDRVNMRVDDNTSSEVICQLKNDEEVNVVGQKGKWFKAAIPKGVFVYVHKTNVSRKNGLGVITEDRSNVRAAATQSSAVVGKLNKGTAVKVIKEYLDWYEIEAPRGTFGWIYGDYVKRDRGLGFKESVPAVQ